MNKSLLALLLVCAIAGMGYGYPWSEEEDQQTIQLLNTLQAMEEREEEVNKQEDDDDEEPNAQGVLKKVGGFIRKLASHGGDSQQLVQLLNTLEEIEEEVNKRAQAQLIGKIVKAGGKIGKHLVG